MRRLLGMLLLLGLAASWAWAQSGDCMPRPSWQFDWGMTDFCNSSVDFSEIIAGGPPKDGIPALTDPKLESIAQAQTWLGERAPVIVVEINGEARAYPQAVLTWHEIANDTLGGVPIAVTFCPLCNSSLVFDRRVGDAVLAFGVSGLLRNSDMVMYDRQTESWWQQFSGEGIVGVYNGTRLEVIPSQVVGFAQFAARYPEGLVVSRETGFARRYGVNPYEGYDSAPFPFLYRGELDKRLPAMERVLAGVFGDTAQAYPFSVLSAQRVINDTLDGQPVVAFWQAGVASALDTRTLDDGAEIGTAGLFARTLDDGRVLTFALDAAGAFVDKETQSTWDAFGYAVAGELAGARLQLLRAAPHFWFAWVAFQPNTSVFGQDE